MSPAGPDTDAVRAEDDPSPTETAAPRVSADDQVAADAENLNRIRAINDRQKLAAIEVSEVINSYIWLHKRYREAAAARDALAGEVRGLRAELEQVRDALEEAPGISDGCDCEINRNGCPQHHTCTPPDCCGCTWCCADLSYCRNATPAAENGANT